MCEAAPRPFLDRLALVFKCPPPHLGQRDLLGLHQVGQQEHNRSREGGGAVHKGGTATGAGSIDSRIDLVNLEA